MEEKDRHDNMPAALKALLEAGRSFSEFTVKNEEIAEAERAAEDPFKYEWDKTMAGFFTKLTEFYWPVVLTMLLTALAILVIQGLSWFVLMSHGAIDLGWWCILPIGIGMLMAAYAQHCNIRDRYSKYTLAQWKVNELRHRQSKQLAHLMVRYLTDEIEAMDRRHNDLKLGVEAAVHTQTGTIPLRPADQLAALQSVWAFIKDKDFPATVKTVSQADYFAYYEARRLINPNEYNRVMESERSYSKHWPEVGEALRAITQKLWESRREGSDPPSAEARREIAKILRNHWGEESYAWCFLRDLGATKDV